MIRCLPHTPKDPFANGASMHPCPRLYIRPLPLIHRPQYPTPHHMAFDTFDSVLRLSLVRGRPMVPLGYFADAPGDWLFHCHILAHMGAGMNAVFRVL